MPKIATKINLQQKQAIEHGDGPALVLAGAGSGKTTVLTHRAAWLIEQQNVSPQQILLVTFTNKAAGEMRERIQSLIDQTPPFVGTFHSFGARFLRTHGHLLGFTDQFSIYDTDDQLSTLKLVYKEHSLDSKRFSYRAVLGQISSIKNDLISPSEYRAIAQGYFQEQVADIFDWYQKKLQQSNAMDFDDLLLHTVHILKEEGGVRAQYQSRFSHVLVDEYQDTNNAQYQLTKILAAPENNLFVVGDFSQSIYAWRGADYRNMLRLSDDYPTIKEYRLEQNYRSHQTILDAATQVISHNRLHPVLSLWTEKRDVAPLELRGARTDTEEATQVTRIILQEAAQTPLHSMAILYRTNAQSRAFEEQLLAASIPYQVVGGVKFYDRKEIKDLLSYIHLIANPQDEISLTRAQKVGKRRLQSFSKWKETQAALASLSPVEMLKGILKVTDYTSQFDTAVPEDVSRLENIAELLRVAARFTSLTEFLENVALIQDGYMLSDASGFNRSGIQLMSLHSAKGLEFSIVFLVGMEEGLLPHSRALTSPEELEEERRLCYVGITRAKEKLFFTFAQSRFAFGTTAKNIPSRFIKDIDQTLFSQSSVKLSAPTQTSRVVISDEFLDQILSGDLDSDSFLA